MPRTALLGVTLTLWCMCVHSLPLQGSRGTHSVTASGVLHCGGLPVTRATVRLASADGRDAADYTAQQVNLSGNGNKTTVTEVVPDENGLFAINGTEKEIAMPDFWLEIMHYCTKTRVSFYRSATNI